MRVQEQHGLSGSPEYVVWRGIIRRCTKATDKDYPDYGGRGITVCERWLTFGNFYKDMGPRPSANHSIDRRDNNLGYEPGNCRWATAVEQHRNTRTNRYITINGVTRCLAEWVEVVGVSYDSALARIQRGEDPEAVLCRTQPPRKGSAPIVHRNTKKTHCPRGHPYSGDNLYLDPKTGYRICRACWRTKRVKVNKLPGNSKDLDHF